MAAALGVGTRPGDVVVSIGTSGTVYAVHDTATGTGIVAGFADATGRFLPLVCTFNAARVLSTTATPLDVALTTLDDLALAAPPGAEGVVLLPYFEGERTPKRPNATAHVAGLRLGNATAANLARSRRRHTLRTRGWPGCPARRRRRETRAADRWRSPLTCRAGHCSVAARRAGRGTPTGLVRR